ncbi:hypothetical protein, partial [Enterococcus faecium]|uniref:hypothetical protein n=1 Tax=Enterococcus faecium TaxID=1352 RepID=UPI00211D2518
MGRGDRRKRSAREEYNERRLCGREQEIKWGCSIENAIMGKTKQSVDFIQPNKRTIFYFVTQSGSAAASHVSDVGSVRCV